MECARRGAAQDSRFLAQPRPGTPKRMKSLSTKRSATDRGQHECLVVDSARFFARSDVRADFQADHFGRFRRRRCTISVSSSSARLPLVGLHIVFGAPALFSRKVPRMLEQMRKSSQSLLIYVLFGIVIAVFIINFGPQSRGGGCDGQRRRGTMTRPRWPAIRFPTSAFRYGFLLLGGAQYPSQMAKQRRLKETVMDKLIERELLAQEAERLGYGVTDEEVEDLVADSKMIGLGYPDHASAACKRKASSTTSVQELRSVRAEPEPQDLHRRAEARAAGCPGARPAARGREGLAGRGEDRLRPQGTARSISSTSASPTASTSRRW